MRLITTYSSLEHSGIAHVNEGSHSITYSAPLLMASVFRRVRNCRFIMIIIVILAHQHKAACRKTRLDIQNYGCNGNLLCDHGVAERNRISSLQSHGKALEKERCLPGVFCDSGDTPANLLCEFNGHLMPCTSCLYGKWVEEVCSGQFGVFVYLVLRCLVGLLHLV